MEEELLELLERVCGDPMVREQLDCDLWGLGLLDSLGLVELLEGIEDRFNLEIYPTQVDPADFATPRGIIALVRGAALVKTPKITGKVWE